MTKESKCPRQLIWHGNADGSLWAPSCWFDDYVPLNYTIVYDPDDSDWTAGFEGDIIETGTLEECLEAVRKFEEECQD